MLTTASSHEMLSGPTQTPRRSKVNHIKQAHQPGSQINSHETWLALGRPRGFFTREISEKHKIIKTPRPNAGLNQLNI